jgi:SAM-dependent methyltransferase
VTGAADLTERIEREHQDAWYERAIRERFFEREGFRRLLAWNVERFRRSVDLTPATRALSIGCGLGEYELALAPDVDSLVALDLSPVAIAEATRRAADAGLANLTFRCASIRECAFDDGSFDLVFAFGVTHHLSEAERAELFARAARWLKPGGTLYLRDPNADGWLRRLLEPWFRRRSDVHSPNEGALSPATLVAELERAGFAVRRIDDVDVIAGPLPWLIESASPLLWSFVFGFDRLCLATPGLRRLSSQFAVTASR